MPPCADGERLHELYDHKQALRETAAHHLWGNLIPAACQFSRGRDLFLHCPLNLPVSIQRRQAWVKQCSAHLVIAQGKSCSSEPISQCLSPESRSCRGDARLGGRRPEFWIVMATVTCVTLEKSLLYLGRQFLHLT